jgi:hypothetical protein
LDVDVRRPRQASLDAPAAAAASALIEQDLESVLAPAKQPGRGKPARGGKPARTAKPDRKARRNSRRPESGQAAAAQAGAATSSAAPVTEALPVRPSPSFREKAAAETTTRPAKSAAPKRAGRSRRGLTRHPVRLVIGAVVVILAVVAVLARSMMGGSGPAHAISTPAKLKAYVLEPQLAQGMGAQALRTAIVKKGNGEATHVVDAVYEISSGPAAKSGPVIMLFIGGNLSGSASSFISSFTGLLPGAFVTSPGALGGQAACVPGYSGHPAECAWADNDTFGLFASPTLTATDLGNELRAMRPLVEHVRK